MHNITKQNPVNGIKRRKELAIYQDAVSTLELRNVQRIQHIIQILSHSVEEMSAFGAMKTHYPMLSQKRLIDIIAQLCKMIRQNIPEFGIGRQPNQTTTRRCVNCAAELRPQDVEYCFHCSPPDESVRIGSELKREHHRKIAGLERDAKALGKLLTKITKRDKREAIDG